VAGAGHEGAAEQPDDPGLDRLADPSARLVVARASSAASAPKCDQPGIATTCGSAAASARPTSRLTSCARLRSTSWSRNSVRRAKSGALSTGDQA
jgi:hypothetical protein